MKNEKNKKIYPYVFRKVNDEGDVVVEKRKDGLVLFSFNTKNKDVTPLFADEVLLKRRSYGFKIRGGTFSLCVFIDTEPLTDEEIEYANKNGKYYYPSREDFTVNVEVDLSRSPARFIYD